MASLTLQETAQNDSTEALTRVAAARELLRLERKIARAENALKILLAHRERLLTVIGGA